MLKYKQLGILCICFVFTYTVNVFVHIPLCSTGEIVKFKHKGFVACKRPFQCILNCFLSFVPENECVRTDEVLVLKIAYL